jgi:hypothetical protein
LYTNRCFFGLAIPHATPSLQLRLDRFLGSEYRWRVRGGVIASDVIASGVLAS